MIIPPLSSKQTWCKLSLYLHQTFLEEDGEIITLNILRTMNLMNLMNFCMVISNCYLGMQSICWFQQVFACDLDKTFQKLGSTVKSNPFLINTLAPPFSLFLVQLELKYWSWPGIFSLARYPKNRLNSPIKFPPLRPHPPFSLSGILRIKMFVLKHWGAADPGFLLFCKLKSFISFLWNVKQAKKFKRTFLQLNI